MSRHQRLNGILELLTVHGHLDVEEVAAQLGVSSATVRRDFDHLASQQLLTRTHGGAVSTSTSYDLPLRYKIARQADEKLRIARAAAAMVDPGATIALNGGTTTNEVARAIASRAAASASDAGPAVTVVTNALNVATELAVRPQCKIVVVGGVVRPQSYELTGPLATHLIEQINIDIAFLGVDAVNPERGATAHHEGEASTNRLLASRARRVVVVADSTKVGHAAFATICTCAEISTLLTDTMPGKDLRRAFEAEGVEVVVADEV